MRVGFIAELTKPEETEISSGSVTKQVLTKAKEVGTLQSDIFRVEITFYQAKSRYLIEKQEIPREDRGDLDNMVKQVLDARAPIVALA